MAEHWQIIGQRQSTDLDASGQVSDVMVIDFEVVGSGTTGSVKVQLRNYTPEFVHAEIDDYVGRIAAVEQL